ncbi:MAG: T9SS type A sorting domain-containing protein [Chitinophagales bacterium]|nr:T9SS type A sorting domain-containing protein [Chitinophagales bacterium]
MTYFIPQKSFPFYFPVKQKFLLILWLIGIVPFAKGQTPDWSTGVATILYDNCVTCHHEGGIAPFSLMTYQNAVDNAFSIQADVNARKMPPWPPDPNYTHFRNEMVLSSSELATINEWVDNGTPEGDISLAPAPPVFNGVSVMQVIDDTLQFPAYTITVPGDDYRAFAIHSNYTETRYLNQIEFLPSNSAIVHHLFLLHDKTDVSWQQEVADTAPGFYGGFLDGFSPYAVIDAGWIPGSSIFSMPYNMGIEIAPGSDFIVNVHYAPGSLGQADSIKVHLKWCDIPEDQVRKVRNNRLLHWHVPSLLNPPFEMPPYTITTFYETSAVMDEDQSLIALQPHMHLIGKSFEIYMVDANLDTTKIMYIPQWNFNWQMSYFLPKIMKVPVGSKILGTGVYDNTENNPFNPSNPPQWVYAGESTLDEMMSCRFWLMDYMPGDENIVLDSSYATGTGIPDFDRNKLSLTVFPNPVTDQLQFMAWLPQHEVIWTLSNSLGTVIKSVKQSRIANGDYAQEIDLSKYPAGVYLLSVQSGNEKTTSKVMVMH